MSPEFFSWEVELEGYEFRTFPNSLVTDEKPPYRLLIPRATGLERTVRRYELLKASALWREFVDLEPTERDIEVFASKYGRLFRPVASMGNPKVNAPTVVIDIPISDLDPIRAYKGDFITRVQTSDTNIPKESLIIWEVGETFDAWYENIVEMKRLAVIWDYMRDGNVTALEQHLIPKTKDRYQWFFVSRPELLEIVKSGQHRELPNSNSIFVAGDFLQSIQLPENFDKPKLTDAVNHTILSNINERLTGISSKVLWNMGKPLSRHLDLMLLPDALVDALWLQFAQAVTRGTEYLKCDRCGKWFTLINRNSEKKLYCDNACKQAAYRERKANEAIAHFNQNRE